jgi:AcrR family transcriptional regulator
MRAGGRRPGNPDTRSQIVAAARASFAADGYAAASLRSIAAEAGVDPSLVHHYFPGGKPALFAAAASFSRDPRDVMLEAAASGEGGVAVVRGFLSIWEDDAGTSFQSLAEAMSTAPAMAAAVREFLQDRVWSQKGGGSAANGALVASQLLGLAWTRYVLSLEPLASADVETIAAWVGPTIDRYIDL